MKKYILIGLFTIIFLATVGLYLYMGTPRTDKIPADALQALMTATQSTLYSLEPWEDPSENSEKLYRFKVLGKTQLDSKETIKAALEFKNAVPISDPGIRFACFDPRQAIQISYKNHVYDFLICYECGYEVIFKDGKEIANLPATGDPSILNNILSNAGVIISKTGR